MIKFTGISFLWRNILFIALISADDCERKKYLQLTREERLVTRSIEVYLFILYRSKYKRKLKLIIISLCFRL